MNDNFKKMIESFKRLKSLMKKTVNLQIYGYVNHNLGTFT